MQLQWRPPKDRGGLSLISYKLEMGLSAAGNSENPGSEPGYRVLAIIPVSTVDSQKETLSYSVFSVTDTNGVETPLVFSTWYYFRVTVVNSNFDGDPFSQAVRTAAVSAPDAPFLAVAGNSTGGSVFLSWTLPQDLGGAAMQGFRFF